MTLVVSPLIALMKDQLAHLPRALPGAMLWRGQPALEAAQTLRAVRVCLFKYSTDYMNAIWVFVACNVVHKSETM